MTQPIQPIRVTTGQICLANQSGSHNIFAPEGPKGPDAYSLGAMTQDLHTWEGRRSADKPDVLDVVNYHLLGRELAARSSGQLALNARHLANIARDLTLTLSDRLEDLFEKQPPRIQQIILQMAEENQMPIKDAKIQYLANDCLFRLIRDHFKLPRLEEHDFIQHNSSSGFVALTRFGSMISCPPSKKDKRTFHYVKMPSRTNRAETGTQLGYLVHYVSIKSPLIIFSEDGTFTTSDLRFLLKIPPEKAEIFEKIRQGSELGSTAIQETIMRTHEPPHKRSIRDKVRSFWLALRSLL